MEKVTTNVHRTMSGTIDRGNGGYGTYAHDSRATNHGNLDGISTIRTSCSGNRYKASAAAVGSGYSMTSEVS